MSGSLSGGSDAVGQGGRNGPADGSGRSDNVTGGDSTSTGARGTCVCDHSHSMSAVQSPEQHHPGCPDTTGIPSLPSDATPSIASSSTSVSSSSSSSSASPSSPLLNATQLDLPAPLPPAATASSSSSFGLPSIRADAALPIDPPPSASALLSSPSSPADSTSSPHTQFSHFSPSAEATAAAVAADPHLLTPLEHWTVKGSELRFNALAGALGGFTSGVFTCPLDVIKTKLQAQGGFAALRRQQASNVGGQGGQAGQGHRIYKGLVGTARVIWQEEGVRGLYRGLGPIVMGYLPTWAVWFTVYNKSKLWMGERYQNPFFISFWSSIVAGASSTIVTNPIWVIKTRLMSQMPSHSQAHAFPRGGGTPTSRPTLQSPWHYNSTLDAARKMYTTEGLLSFYSGLTPALLGLTHVAVQFPAYEYFKVKFTGQSMGESAVAAGDTPPPAHWLGILSATVLSKILASSLTYPHEVIRTRLQTQRRHIAYDQPGPPPQQGTSPSQMPSAAQQPQQPMRPPELRYRGVIKTFRTILQEEGWRAFYAGMGTNMMRAVPAATVTMLTYEYVMRSLKQTRHDALVKLEAVL